MVPAAHNEAGSRRLQRYGVRAVTADVVKCSNYTVFTTDQNDWVSGRSIDAVV